MTFHHKRWVPLLVPLFLAACGSSGDTHADLGMSCDGHTIIHVVAKGLEHSDGQVLVALYASSDGFPNDSDKALQSGTATMDSTQATFTFTEVPRGTYAVSVLHDEDGNGAMKTQSFGRPAEGWGVSNDAKGRFGPPKFKNAAFEAMRDSVSIELIFNY